MEHSLTQPYYKNVFELEYLHVWSNLANMTHDYCIFFVMYVEPDLGVCKEFNRAGSP